MSAPLRYLRQHRRLLSSQVKNLGNAGLSFQADALGDTISCGNSSTRTLNPFAHLSTESSGRRNSGGCVPPKYNNTTCLRTASGIPFPCHDHFKVSRSLLVRDFGSARWHPTIDTDDGKEPYDDGTGTDEELATCHILEKVLTDPAADSAGTNEEGEVMANGVAVEEVPQNNTADGDFGIGGESGRKLDLAIGRINSLSKDERLACTGSPVATLTPANELESFPSLPIVTRPLGLHVSPEKDEHIRRIIRGNLQSPIANDPYESARCGLKYIQSRANLYAILAKFSFADLQNLAARFDKDGKSTLIGKSPDEQYEIVKKNCLYVIQGGTGLIEAVSSSYKDLHGKTFGNGNHTDVEMGHAVIYQAFRFLLDENGGIVGVIATTCGKAETTNSIKTYVEAHPIRIRPGRLGIDDEDEDDKVDPRSICICILAVSPIPTKAGTDERLIISHEIQVVEAISHISLHDKMPAGTKVCDVVNGGGGGTRNEVAWMQRYDELKEYKEEQRDCNVPRGWKKNPQLGRWVNTQRKQYQLRKEGKLSAMTEERIQLLEDVGFEWSINGPPTDWNIRYDELKEYKEEHGNCNVPNRRREENPQLGWWVKNQRIQYQLRKDGKPSPMTKERIALLELIGFEWYPNEAGWEAQYGELIQYKEKCGDCNVPQGWEENPQLGRWVKNQRHQYQLRKEGKPSSMTKERIQLLDDIGFEWSLNEAGWKAQYDELRQYKEEHGDCNVPGRWEKNPQLGRWVAKQRYQYQLRKEGKPSSMTKERIQLLDDIGFEWSPNEAGWEAQYVQLRQYKEKCGDCNVPIRSEENPQLGRWVKNQRYQYQLRKEGKPSAMTEERIALLELIGFEWSPNEASWKAQYDELREYKEKCGDCNVPIRSEENPQLGRWVAKQRYQYQLRKEGKPSAMTEERIALLELIGFEWSLKPPAREERFNADSSSPMQ